MSPLDRDPAFLTDRSEQLAFARQMADQKGRAAIDKALGDALVQRIRQAILNAAGGRIGGYGPSGVPTKRFLLALECVELPA